MLGYLKSLVPAKARALIFPIRERLFDLYATKSYSQEGEDMVLRRMFEGQGSGFYVDVGAHHPRRFSNTNFYYKQGWHGINIEPNPDAVIKFRNARHRDINLQCGVSDIESQLSYHKFNDPALNTFDPSVASDRINNTPYKLIEQVQVPVRRLDSIFRDHLKNGQRIDFLTVDVEGFDLQVLMSNNWNTHRPRVVLAESLNSTLEDIQQNEIAAYMIEQQYSVFAKTYNTWIFKDRLSQ